MSSRNANDGCLPNWLGSGHEWPLGPRSVEGPSALLAHKPAGADGCVSITQTLPPRPAGPPCVSSVRQHFGGLVYKSPGGIEIASVVEAHASHANMGPRQDALAQGDVHPGGPECSGRLPVEAGSDAGRMETPPEVVEELWIRFGRAQVDLFASRETTHCPAYFSLTHPAPLGLDAMVQTWPRLRLYAFPPLALLPGVLERVRRDGVQLLLVAPLWPGRVWLADIMSLLEGPPWEIPVRRDLLSQAGGSVLHPRPELWKRWAWPLRGPSS